MPPQQYSGVWFYFILCKDTKNKPCNIKRHTPFMGRGENLRNSSCLLDEKERELSFCLQNFPWHHRTDMVDGACKEIWAQKVDLKDQSGGPVALDWFLGPQLPWSRHPALPRIPISEETMLAAKDWREKHVRGRDFRDQETQLSIGYQLRWGWEGIRV